MIMHIPDVGEARKTNIGVSTVLDYQIMRWNSGKIFIRYLLKDLIEDLVKDMHRNIADHYDNLLVIEGPEGSGKSNLAYDICSAFCKAEGKKFDVTTQYVYSVEDFKEKLRAGDDIHNIFWMDEGSNMANNREWNTNDSKNLIELLEMCRSRGWTMVWCIPSHERLDVYIREFRLRYLLRCEQMEFQNTGLKERGYFELKKRTPYGKMDTIGYGMFDQIPKEDKKIYEDIKLQAQATKIKNVIDPETPGSKYKSKYEETSKKLNKVMLELYNSGFEKAELMELFEIENESTFKNALSKARKYENQTNSN